MIQIQGKSQRRCDGVTRRGFLNLGALGLAGLSLPKVLRAQEARPDRRRDRAVILCWMAGGPSHQGQRT